MTDIRLTTRGKVVLALAGIAASVAAIYAVTPDECRSSDTNRTVVCGEYLR
jgi:hypothetical protein